MDNLDLLAFVAPKFFYSILCGGLVGYEREKTGAPAGLKTQILICLGSMLFTVAALVIVPKFPHVDPSRVFAQIVSGIGFLGAGAILRGGDAKVVGLTTAAHIWTIAALGILVGLDYGPAATVISGGIVLTTLTLRLIERRFIRLP